MGLILCSWGRAIGATVIGTASTPEKTEIARIAGCHHPVVRSNGDFVAKCSEGTDGKGVAVVYESIGMDTLQKSLDCLRYLGVCAVYGHASGPPEPVDIIQDLGERGSLFIPRPAFLHYMTEREQMVAAAEVLFQTIRSSIIEPNINYEYPLKDSVMAHQAIESGTATGTSVLLV